MTINNINNLPNYAKTMPHIVVTEIDGELWFWGAYSTEEQAEQVAYEIGGMVIDNR